MIYFPPLRRLLLPSLVCLAFILYYRSTSVIPGTRIHLSNLIIRDPDVTPEGFHVPLNELDHQQIYFGNISENYNSPPLSVYYPYHEPGATYHNGTDIAITYLDPATHEHLQRFFQCPREPNPITDHIRLPNLVYNISLIFMNETENERKSYLNPAIISLPSWSPNQYLVIGRVVTDGSHQQNLLCEANICYTGDAENARAGEQPCGDDDMLYLGGKTGMRCAMPPMTLNVPPTPAKKCPKSAEVMTDVPGFHDPRVFWTGKGEPLMMVNTQYAPSDSPLEQALTGRFRSRYACFGLWAIDLRKMHEPLDALLDSDPTHPDSSGPLMSYPALTELTRNPAASRGSVEKNWMFFSSNTGAYIHYDMNPTKRTFAKLLGGGLTTVNLTDPREMPCIEDPQEGKWHQGTNSLRLVLCDRSDPNCTPNGRNEVYFAIIHYKRKGMFDLPMRYERNVMVWSAEPPFSMLGVSKHPLLMYNETATGFEPEEGWQDDPEQQALLAAGEPGKENWALFTYTVSIAWAWGRQNDASEGKNLGYLDEEVILGIGVDDKDMVFSRVLARDLLQCLRACPPRSPTPLYVNPNQVQDDERREEEEHEKNDEEEEKEAEAEAEVVEEVSEGAEKAEASASREAKPKASDALEAVKEIDEAEESASASASEAGATASAKSTTKAKANAKDEG
ncbi:MAG: hypothetical protein M1828_004569 [Chrysothrix sp. TS-e1954]|nr:MAG: hypothetical protein M1828_004569 [Chrysothrix sp. TS-e1954]